jgi:hypothetical protein
MNYYNKENIYNDKYFDRRMPEEDSPLKLEPELQLKYEQLEIVYDEIFDEESHQQAKVQNL